LPHYILRWIVVIALPIVAARSLVDIRFVPRVQLRVHCVPAYHSANEQIFILWLKVSAKHVYES